MAILSQIMDGFSRRRGNSPIGFRLSWLSLNITKPASRFELQQGSSSHRGLRSCKLLRESSVRHPFHLTNNTPPTPPPTLSCSLQKKKNNCAASNTSKHCGRHRTAGPARGTPNRNSTTVQLGVRQLQRLRLKGSAIPPYMYAQQLQRY